MAAKVLWITGLPGSGKSTIADALKAARPDLVILRMDDLRKTVTPDPAYSEAERDLVYRSIVYFAGRLSELGHNVLIDATGNLRKWRELARELIPAYSEVYLKCRVDECIKREGEREETRDAPKEIYKKGQTGWPVPGMSTPYEEPLNPELIINTELVSVSEAVDLIREKILKS